MRSIKDVMDSMGLMDIHKKNLIRLYPNLAGLNFTFALKNKKCPRCIEQEKRHMEEIPVYWVQIEGEEEKEMPSPELCPTCEIEVEVDAWAKEDIKRRRGLFMDQYTVIPEELKDASFQNFQRTSANAELFKLGATYLKNFLDGSRKSLFLYGSYGVGKSHMARAIQRRLREEGYLVGFMTTGELLAKIKSTYNKEADTTEADILNNLKAFDCFVLDEIGAESQGLGRDAWAVRMMIQIVNTLLGIPTITTSNFSLQQLEGILDGRTVDRLYSNTEKLEVNGSSWRRK